MHALLDWEGHPAPLPTELLGLTDKPPGSYGPKDRWWPSVGCGPVGNWWALWWTQPDEQARRGGMVRSEVALWPLDEVGAVNNLRPVMESLGGQERISLPPVELLGAVAESLVSPNPGPPILQDLDMWPGVVAALWIRLWPEARRAFSARVAVSPPQGGESVSPPWIFGVPPDRALQWSGYQGIAAIPGLTQLSRAARWLVGETDSTFDEVLTACPSMPAELGWLRRVARAADRLERLREAPDPQRARDLLRTLLALAPAADAAVALKAKALGILERGLVNESLPFVLSLANLEVAGLPEQKPLEHALEIWTSNRVTELPLEEASQLLEELLPGKETDWWRQAVHTSLATGLAKPELRWAAAALRWLGSSSSAEVLRDLLPASEEIEQRLLAAISTVELDQAALTQLRHEAAKRRWSRLHAWAVMQALSPREALRAQRAFAGDRSAGLALLVEDLPGDAVVDEAISKPDTQLTELVGRRTAREPALLAPMDATHPAWRSLWAAHMKAGGQAWPPGGNRDVLGRGLLDAVLEGNEPDGLVVSVADGLVDSALDHPERAALWNALSTAGRAALLPRVAEALIRACDGGRTFSTPEPELGTAVMRRVRQSSPSARAIAALLNWNIRLEEEEVIRWIRGTRSSGWAPVAVSVGRGVRARGWTRAASELYERSKDLAELRPAVEACRELLSSWQRWVLSWSGSSRTLSDSDDALLMDRVAKLGASLAPDRLEDLWVRAGGERSRLQTFGAPDMRWRDAVSLAQHGALEGGLTALVHELRTDFPYNKDLRELEELLVAKR